MDIPPETITDGSDWLTDELADTCAIPVQPPLKTGLVTAIDAAISQWNVLRKGAPIPKLASTALTDQTFLNRRALQIVWYESVSDQAVTYIGGDLTQEFAIHAGDIWSGRQEPGTLAPVLRKISDHSIRWGRLTDLRQEIVSNGTARNYRILVLPFAVEHTRAKLVAVLFDWTHKGVSDAGDHDATGGDEMLNRAGAFPQAGEQDVLLLEQELDSSEAVPSGPAGPSRPYFMVSMAGQRNAGCAGSSDTAGDEQTISSPPLPSSEQTQSQSARREPPAVTEPGPEVEALLLTDVVEPAPQAFEPAAVAPMRANVADLPSSLETARSHASVAMNSEERSHAALYAAIGAAHDFALCTAEEPGQYQAMIEAAGFKVQPRAPFAPIVKLVFGAEYDRTRLAEYAAALAHAQRAGVPRGCLTDYLAAFDGGLKALVRLERQQRRSGPPAERGQLERLKDRLREAQIQAPGALASGDEEFVLVLARRLPEGGMAMLGKVPEDEQLLSRAARAFLAQVSRVG